MNIRRINRYLSLIERGAIEAQRRMLLIRNKKASLVGSLAYGKPFRGGFSFIPSFMKGLKNLEIRARRVAPPKEAALELKRLVLEDELPLVLRIERGMKNFRKSLKYKNFRELDETLVADIETFKDTFNRTYKLIKSYLNRIKAEAGILESINDSNFDMRVQQFVWAYEKEKETYGKIIERLGEIRQEYPKFILDIDREMKKLITMNTSQNVTRQIGETITFASIIFFLAFFAEVFNANVDDTARESFSLLRTVIGSGLSTVGFLGGIQIQLYEEKIAEFFYRLRK